MKLADLKANPNNPRIIKDEKFARLQKSLKEFPQMMALRPIVIDESGMILGGNMRLAALKANGLKEIPDDWVKRADELTEEQKQEFIIKDNNSFGEYNWDVLANEWSDLPLSDWGVDLPQDWLETREPKDAEPQIDKAAELQQKWQVATGEIIQIGRHRLMCGDSTGKRDVEALCVGNRPLAVVTDPPYGMNLDTDWSDAVGSLKSIGHKHQTRGKKYDRVIGDDAPFDPVHILEFARNIKEVFLFGADYYAERIPERGEGSWLVWDKRKPSQSEAIGSEFELIWSKAKHKRRILRHDWFGFLSSENAAEARNRAHPTQKPTSLVAEIIDLWKLPSPIIDFYAGSGTTLVAAENLNRTCYAMEISPEYCAVILERMTTAFPGIEIKRESQAIAA